MIFKGTDTDAFNKASRGKTPKKRRELYQKEKTKNEKQRERKGRSLFPVLSSFTSKNPRRSTTVVKSAQVRRAHKYKMKRTILDDVRDYRSSKIVSNISNCLAIFAVKYGGRQWDNDTKNLIRSSIALAISEVTNKVLEKPLETIDNIKLFIKVGKIIYKIIAWLDKTTNLWTTDNKSISIVLESDTEYIKYVRQYPYLAKPIQVSNAGGDTMKYKVGDIVLLNNGQTVCIIMVDKDTNTYHAVTTDDDKKKYTFNDTEIYDVVGYV